MNRGTTLLERQLIDTLSGLVDGMKQHCNEPAGGGISGFLGARLTDAETLLARLPIEPCTVPPEGWACSRHKGHDGPCAARPISGLSSGPADAGGSDG